MIKTTTQLLFILLIALTSCKDGELSSSKKPAEILGNPDYMAFSYGGYRGKTRQTVPGVEELKEDMKILHAMGTRVVRTYNTQQFAQAANLLAAIRELKQADKHFEMYVMLGAWIDCKGAWTDNVNHDLEDEENNSAEINAAMQLANEYPDIVKFIAVGNEAMVHWASSYFVQPGVILKWVNYLQEKKSTGALPADIWITSSDNFASWGGAEDSYHKEDLNKLIAAVDFISMHTYPFHDTHYNPDFWRVPEDTEQNLSNTAIIEAAMLRAKQYAISQYGSVYAYMTRLGIEKPIHIGETGWASKASSNYGANGSKAADEYKEKLYYQHMREWSNKMGLTCFYFEAFDEQWKDPNSELGSENHFGLINLKSQAKYALWDLVDEGVFEGLTRNGLPITKTYGGSQDSLMKDVLLPPRAND